MDIGKTMNTVNRKILYYYDDTGFNMLDYNNNNILPNNSFTFSLKFKHAL